MKIRFLLRALALLIGLPPCAAQDTIRLEPPVHYTKDNYPKGCRGYCRLKYAREEVVLSKTHRKVEYCYYLDKVRKCKREDYRFEGDTVVVVGDTARRSIKRWRYVKIEDSLYYVANIDGAIKTAGLIRSLLPFADGKLIATATNIKDTLWFEEYAKQTEENPFPWPDYSFTSHFTPPCKIYSFDEIDDVPRFQNGDTVNSLLCSFPYFFPCSDTHREMMISLIINHEGKVRSICGVYAYDSYEFMTLIRSLKSMEPFIPAKKDGQAVDVYWFMLAKSEGDETIINSLAPGSSIQEYRLIQADERKRGKKAKKSVFYYATLMF